MEVLMIVMVLGICVIISYGLLKWNEIRFNFNGTTTSMKRLPPGTMGWPFFGETADFLKHGPDFIKKQRARYGSIFKSHIFGSPTIICMDAEVNRYVLLNEVGKGLVPGYPQSVLDILGKCNIAAVYGSTHKYMRGSLLSLIAPPMLKDHLLPKIDKYMRIHLLNWAGKTLDIQEKTNEMAFFILFKTSAESESSSFYEAFRREFDKLIIGSLSLPINFPGTYYYQGIQGRKGVIRMLRQIMEKRRRANSDDTMEKSTSSDFLDHLLRNVNGDSKYELNDEEILDQAITILYSGYETVSTTSMMAIKYLHHHPKALQQIRDEHFRIREKKMREEPIDWNDYKSMSFTRAVIFETQRLATIVNGVLRKTTDEIELNGYVIPKGWRIYVYTREINYDPLLYPEPLSFNPWRWLDKSMESQNYFFLFGAGTRLCPGKELGIAMISTFLHYFLTSYRWEEVGEEKIEIFPRVEAPNGLHIRVSNY